MRIYEYTKAPNCRRVRVFLAEKGLDMEFVQVDIASGENLTPEYRARDANAKVPVLELSDGTCIAESVAIQRYLEELHPEPALFGRDPRERALVEMWNRRADFNLMFNIGMNFQHSSGFFADRMELFPEFGRECGRKAMQFLSTLDQHLASSPYLVDEYYSVADISMLCALDFGKVVKIRPDTSEHPNLVRWHTAVSQRPSARA
ncbi:glutathione S-transferase family protein [Microbulbifer sp. 2201CG32-9]|uniref:glutathione S-transferase family protein n=1 Tax=Microbulbifer sp. 2201CG32-9 TaxID=3232309 RepID=UPI00345C0CA0